MKLGMVLLARALALAWAGFWTFFFVAEGLAWRTPARVVVSWGCVGLLFVILALLPWRWEVAGGIVLVVLGLLFGVAYPLWPLPLPLASRVTTTVVLSGPPLVAGVILLIHRRAETART